MSFIINLVKNRENEVATLGAGCFWCTEAVFQNIKGVVEVVSGYSGGSVKNPTYEQICSSSTGHAEVSQITYDPKILSYDELLFIFWGIHNPTTLNQQGNDVGSQYRSVIFYHNQKQKKIAELSKKRLAEDKIYDSPIVTEIAPFEAFYPAENYHQNYYSNNPDKMYCKLVIGPKMAKLRKEFSKYLKS
jgi:peptide-methionine (S)-S-oxide reductase